MSLYVDCFSSKLSRLIYLSMTSPVHMTADSVLHPLTPLVALSTAIGHLVRPGEAAWFVQFGEVEE